MGLTGISLQRPPEANKAIQSLLGSPWRVWAGSDAWDMLPHELVLSNNLLRAIAGTVAIACGGQSGYCTSCKPGRQAWLTPILQVRKLRFRKRCSKTFLEQISELRDSIFLKKSFHRYFFCFSYRLFFKSTIFNGCVVFVPVPFTMHCPVARKLGYVLVFLFFFFFVFWWWRALIAMLQ